MGIHRRAAKRDTSEPDIIEALLRVGAQVARLTQPVDLAVRFRGRLYLLECKTPGKSLDKRQQTQAEFCREWEIPYVKTPEEALKAIGATQ